MEKVMAGLHWSSIVLFFCELTSMGLGQFTLAQGSGGDVVVNPLSFYTCEGTDSAILQLNLRNANDDVKVLDVELNTDYDFTEDWQLDFKMDKWNNGAWDEIYSDNDSACKILNQFIPRIWAKMRKEVSLSGDCTMETGNYKLTDFEASREEYDVPSPMLGRYRFSGRLTDESGNEILCQMAEAEMNRK